MSWEGKLGSYLQKLLWGPGQTWIPVEQNVLFLVLFLKVRCWKSRVLPGKEILCAGGGNDIKCMHLNHYIFCYLSRVCGHSLCLWKDYTLSAVNKVYVYLIAFLAERLSPFSFPQIWIFIWPFNIYHSAVFCFPLKENQWNQMKL